jgi:membrane protein DedA with SNARE-associated domain
VLQHLLDSIAHLGHWSYLLIFIAAALECAAFAGLVVPGESVVLASGFFAHRGILEFDAVLAAAAVGAAVGDNIGYQLGARLGRSWLLKHGARVGLRQDRLARAEAFFRRHGARAVFVGRFIGFARALVPFVAGASGMPFRQFLLYDALGAVLWTVGFVSLGYGLGAGWHLAERWLGRLSAIVGVACVLALLLWLWRRRARGARG